MDELDRYVLRVGRIGSTSKRQQSPSLKEALGHLSASYRKPTCLARKEVLKDPVAFEQPFFYFAREIACLKHRPFLTDPRQRIAHQHVDNPAASIKRRDQDRSGRLLRHFADPSCLAPPGGTMQHLECSFRLICRYHSEKLSLVGDI